MPRVVIACALLLGGCASALRGDLPPDRLRDLPWTDAPADVRVLQARALVDRGEDKEALGLVEAVLATEPRHVDANRLRQDLLRERGRRGLAVAELERALARQPDDPLWNYLRGRVAFGQRDKRRWFAHAAELAPDLVWPWLGLGHSLADLDPARSLAIYERLYLVTDAHPLVAIAYAQALRRAGATERVAAVCATLASDQRLPGVGDL
ncbi:MAG: tetratricopeptide repeat protein, partial [Planctomycetes bacterium]|nr:tetratricopeptide repeat protein [Planctomycetota bacterium]